MSRLHSIVNQFPNGLELYRNNAIFRRIADSMDQGGIDVYEVVTILIEHIEDNQKWMDEMIQKFGNPQTIILENKVLTKDTE